MRAFCALPCKIGDDQECLAGQRIGGIEHARRGHWRAGTGRARRAPWRRGRARRGGAARRRWRRRPAWRHPPLPAWPAAPPAARAAMARGDLSPRNRDSRRSRSTLSPPRPRSVSSTASSPPRRLPGPRGLSDHVRQPRPAEPACASRCPSASCGRSRRWRRVSSRRRASVRAGAGGGSRKASFAGSATPKAAQSSTSPDRSASRISGGVKAASAAVCSARHSLIAMPGLRAPGAPGALIGRSTRHAHRLQPGQPGRRLVFRQARQAAIDDDAHAVDGDRGFGDRGRKHHLAAASGRRPDRGVLRLAVQHAVERHDVGVGRNAALQPLGGALDLALAGQEGEHAAASRSPAPRGSPWPWRPRSAPRRRARHSGSRPESCGPCFPCTGAPPSSLPTRAPSSVADITSSLQIRPQRALHVERQRQPEIAVERAFVELVEEDGGDARQFRIVEDHAGKTPSVTTRMRVLAETRFSMRMA